MPNATNNHISTIAAHTAESQAVFFVLHLPPSSILTPSSSIFTASVSIMFVRACRAKYFCGRKQATNQIIFFKIMRKSIFAIALIAVMGFVAPVAKAQFAPAAADVKPLMVGQAVPDVALQDGTGASRSLHTVIGERPTLIITYRGDWCTNCINHFNAEIFPNLQRINALGYNVMFVGPDSPDFARTTAGKINVTPAMVYSDATGAFSVAMGIAWQQPERMLERLAEYSGGKNPGFLPIPAVFVVGADKNVLFVDPRPTAVPAAARIKGNLLMAVLENLR